ncbi:MAG: FAD-dependent oxidoreductase, partial [Gemmatimonadaceae bacterium]|nr:FAD-dependent oxidoreductase [Gemmatimonadaceae bacterium]
MSRRGGGGGARMVTRRAAVTALLAVPATAVLGAPMLVGLTRKAPRRIAGGYAEDESAIGHALRDGTPARSAPARRERVQVLIVGGGVSGLCAAWELARSGVRDVRVLEAAPVAGGNARSGERDGLRFPWGAHYLPVPAASATLVREFCTDVGLLQGGVWNERALTFAPQERLFQHGRWHEGIEPDDALSRTDRDELRRFEERVASWRASGAFSVPSVSCAARGARAFAPLDDETMAQWMAREGFRSPALRWLVDYGVRDDYGASVTTASAWAGIHYFAGRPANETGPLTWPEGNAWLVERLLARVGDTVRTNAPVWRIAREGTRWIVETREVR